MLNFSVGIQTKYMNFIRIFQVGFCSKACENEARKPPRARDPQARKAYHLYECGLLNAIRIGNFAGTMRLIGAYEPEAAVSAFTCVADTNPDELLRSIGQFSLKNVRFMYTFGKIVNSLPIN